MHHHFSRTQDVAFSKDFYRLVIDTLRCVHAGLRMAPGCAQMTRTWIVYNKPKVASYTHAGMIMGLGLTSASLSSLLFDLAQHFL